MRYIFLVVFLFACGQPEPISSPDLAPRFLEAKCKTIQFPPMPDVIAWPDGFVPIKSEINCGLTSADKRWANFYTSYARIQDEYGRDRGDGSVKCVEGIPTISLPYKIQIAGTQLSYIIRDKMNERATFACWVSYSYIDYMGILTGDEVCKLSEEETKQRHMVCRWDPI